MTTSNRSLTVNGANKIFEPAGVVFSRHELGYYQTSGLVEKQAPTLTALCQAVVTHLMELAGK